MIMPRTLTAMTGGLLSAVLIAAPVQAEATKSEIRVITGPASANPEMRAEHIPIEPLKIMTVQKKPELRYGDYTYPNYELVTDYTSRALSPPPQGYYYAEIDLGVVKVVERTNLIVEFAH